MRLPLRHPPLKTDAPVRRCAHLERLVEGLIGVPLGPAAELVAPRRSRGRHGNALQWHLGLASHDGAAVLDWENRIEIKLVSVWRRPNGTLACDKLKVCDIAMSPWRKLSNVMFVFADRLTRVVVAATAFTLRGDARRRLEASWRADPHFGEPLLFVEARERRDDRQRRSPAYYLASRWLSDEGILSDGDHMRGVFGFDPSWSKDTRAEFGRDPLATIVDGSSAVVVCPRCQGPVHYNVDRLLAHGWSPARHGMPLGERCAFHGHFTLHASRLIGSGVQSRRELCEGLEGRLSKNRVWRVADRVPEPEDHEHT